MDQVLILAGNYRYAWASTVRPLAAGTGVERNGLPDNLGSGSSLSVGLSIQSILSEPHQCPIF